MGKKKKKVKVFYKDSQKKFVSQSISEQIRNPKLDPAAQKEATSRLVTLFKKLGEKPEPILDMLYRLEIPWRREPLVEDGEDYIIIKAADLDAGEARHQGAGSIVNRLYGDKVAQQMPEMPENTHNPVTGEELPKPEPAPAFTTMEEEPLAKWERDLMYNEVNQPAPGTPDPADEDEYLRGIQG